MAFSCPLKVRLSVPDLASNILAIASPLPVYTAKEKNVFDAEIEKKKEII